jgi:hypothetical protein
MEYISNPANKKPAAILPKGPLFISNGMGDQAHIKRLFMAPVAPVLNGKPIRG